MRVAGSQRQHHAGTAEMEAASVCCGSPHLVGGDAAVVGEHDKDLQGLDVQGDSQLKRGLPLPACPSGSRGGWGGWQGQRLPARCLMHAGPGDHAASDAPAGSRIAAAQPAGRCGSAILSGCCGAGGTPLSSRRFHDRRKGISVGLMRGETGASGTQAVLHKTKCYKQHSSPLCRTFYTAAMAGIFNGPARGGTRGTLPPPTLVF